ncbi:MAG: hypothetical protein LPK45_02780 [Bacteroidota bacterium]|nr:hypothetical protein [Bacteroidota bacterium]MDX5429965.1 hypothetical protein [Bacteroidota bacterium]MDX5468738.1 hypothetical protein [Bacteroidota bacterium]
MLRVLILPIFLLSVCLVHGQKSLRFKQEVLNNPKAHAKEIESLFKIQITKKVNPAFLKNTVSLENGYAKYEIANAEPWYQVKDGVQATEVSLVFSKYPKDFNFWQTNYYELLANRLKTLFDIDPELNDTDIQFNLVLETACETEDDAKKLYHGFLIKYRELSKKELKEREAKRAAELAAGAPPDYSGVKRRVERYMKNAGGMLDSSVYKAFDRNRQWENALVVIDWTSSMYQYSAQCLAWHLDYVDTSGIRYFAFFNDGDAKWEYEKKLGETGGIYFGSSDNMSKVVRVFNTAMRKGLGGEMPENDVEAILKSMEQYSDYKEIVLVADNSMMRDFDLWDQIKHPVRVILADGDWTVNPQYLNLAYLTGGSFHTGVADIDFKNGADTLIKVSGMEFVLDRELNLYVCKDKEKCRYLDQELAAREKKNLEELKNKPIYRTMHKDNMGGGGFKGWWRRLWGKD